MDKQLSQSFNFSAEKIVNLKEWRQKTKALYKDNLSTDEKIFLNLVDKPLSAVVSLAFGLKDALSGHKADGVYMSTAPLAVYVSGAFVQEKVKGSGKFLLRQEFQNKINGLAAKAFEECEDHSKKPIMQGLKAL